MKPRTRDKTKEGQSIIVPSSVLLYSESSSVFLGTQCVLRISCVQRSPLDEFGHIDADKFEKGIHLLYLLLEIY